MESDNDHVRTVNRFEVYRRRLCVGPSRRLSPRLERGSSVGRAQAYVDGPTTHNLVYGIPATLRTASTGGGSSAFSARSSFSCGLVDSPFTSR